MKREHLYEFFIFIDSSILVLENDSIIDINLKKFSPKSEKDDALVVETDESFFLHRLKQINSIENDFSVVLQSYNRKSGWWESQIEIYGDYFTIEDNKILFEFDSMSVNHARPSINPYWQESIDLYRKERVSYLRNIQIETLLN
jgi:hypothetical protein